MQSTLKSVSASDIKSQASGTFSAHVKHPFPPCADEEKPAPVPASFNTAASSTAAQARTASHLPFLNKLQELNTTRLSSTLIVSQSFIAVEVNGWVRDRAQGCLLVKDHRYRPIGWNLWTNVYIILLPLYHIAILVGIVLSIIHL